jgi:hypothetical protein
MPIDRVRQLLFVLQCSTIAACGGSNAATCTRDDDCASHFCKADGTCGPADVDAGTDGAQPGSDAPSALCSPNHDGKIELGELPLVAGRTAKFRIATNATFATAGHANGDGTRSWDLSGALANDSDHDVVLLAPAGTWWAADFPSASYAVTLSASSDLLGVFAVGTAGVTLLGVVSPDGGAFSTELTYDPPAKLLAVPFGAGDTWSSTSTVSGTAQGAVTAYTEKYESRVDELGTMTTPYGPFPVLRIATDLTRTAGAALLLSNRTFAWAAECFGSVAQATSQDFETSAEFSDPSEVRRLVP